MTLRAIEMQKRYSCILALAWLPACGPGGITSPFTPLPAWSDAGLDAMTGDGDRIYFEGGSPRPSPSFEDATAPSRPDGGAPSANDGAGAESSADASFGDALPTDASGTATTRTPLTCAEALRCQHAEAPPASD
jgi:hypothetical protein